MYKSECPRCHSGKGHINAFKHVQNGVCFKCNGIGYILTKTDPAKLEQQRQKRAAAKAEKQAIQQAEGQKRYVVIEKKYINDPRIGSETKQSCENHTAYAYEVYTLLNKIDNGQIKDYTHIIRNIKR